MNDNICNNVIDLQGLHDRCMGNLDLVHRVLDKFETRLPDELAELERMLESHDAAKISAVAHRIKGSCANVSASGLRNAAAEIEDLSRAGRLTEIDNGLKTLRNEWRRYVDFRGSTQSSLRATHPCGIKLPDNKVGGGAS